LTRTFQIGSYIFERTDLSAAAAERGTDCNNIVAINVEGLAGLHTSDMERG
jgi:hypothetical protein